MRSSRAFDRWAPFEQTTWSFQIFSRYDDQLGMIGTAHTNAMKFVFASLHAQGRSWTDDPGLALGSNDKFMDSFRDLEHWSENYNLFENWACLSAVLSCAANLETYMAGVIDLAIRSDPGLLFGSFHALDGAVLLKNKSKNLDVERYIVSCTKGDWSARFAALEKLFGPLPASLKLHHGALEDLRNIRNRVGHAFGRDIAQARDHGVRAFRPMETIRRRRAIHFVVVCRTFARTLDRHLLERHVGEFELIRFFADHHNDLEGRTVSERGDALKKAVGRIGAPPRGKIHCRGLIRYWDDL